MSVGYSEHVECVLINAYYSEIQADAIVQYISYIIGMEKEIGDTAAVKFAVGFYDALGAGKSMNADMQSKRHIWSYWNAIGKRVKGTARHSFFQPKPTASSSLRNGTRGEPILESGNSVVQLTL